MDTYASFIASKRIVDTPTGMKVDIDSISPVLFNWQRAIVRWALARGRAAMFEDCGLGKTLQQLEWARHVVAFTGGRVLIVAPLAVADQTVSEATKLGMSIEKLSTPRADMGQIVATNYERIHRWVDADIAGIVLDESSILKSIDGKTRKMLLESFTSIHWRLCCTATPAPNDIAELANHAQFLGVMSRAEMLASFFVHDDEGWRLRGHASEPFYRWLASWAMALKSPDDIGFDGSAYVLQALRIHDHIVETDWRRDGELFPGKLKGIGDRASVRKSSVEDRVRATVALANGTDEQMIVWCGLNAESAMAAAAIDGAIEVCGSDDPEVKIDAIMGFVSGRYRVLVTKPSIAGFGMNFQHAARMVFVGLNDSYETYYQAIRRCWRYGQTRPVDVHIVITDHETEIVENVRRKETDADRITREIIAAARGFEMEEIGRIEARGESMETAIHAGTDWTLHQDDCVRALAHVKDASVGLSVFSPPFISLYTYSASSEDMGNSRNQDTFFDHFRFLIDELMRVIMPGRLVCVHAQQVALRLGVDGVIGLQDFRGRLISEFTARQWVYHGEVCIDKDPQAQAIRTKSKSLLFVQLRKDSMWSRPALADYIIMFRKPGENEHPIHPDITNEDWIQWARPIWYGIRESETLNAVEARSDDDDRHICPLQLGTIERCVRLWSNPGDLVLSPFAGIGSEGYVALKHGRRFIGAELKPLYARVAARNLALAVERREQPTLWDTVTTGAM